MEIIKKVVFLLAFIFFGVGTSFGESAAIQSLPLQNVPFYEGIEEFSQRIQQIRETEQREPLGLVLCGGSARAFAHIGVLQAMEENGIVPDFIVANSMGAIIGMLYSYGFSPDQMYKIANTLNLNSYFDLVAPLKGGIVSVRRFTALINELLGKEFVDIKDCAIPILLLTEDLNTKRQIWHASGDFAQVMAAAFAMSFFMEPVDYVLESGVKVKLVDSGTIDIAGLKVADAFSKNLIVSTAFYDKKMNLNNPIVVINRTISIGKERLAISDIRQLQPVLIRNDVEKFSFMEFKKIHELVQVGYDSTMKAMEEIVARPHGYREFSERRKETTASSNELIKRLERNPEIKIQQNYLGMKIRPNISALDYPSLYLCNTYGAGIYGFMETPSWFGRLGVGANFTSPDYSVDMYVKFRPNYFFQAEAVVASTFLYDKFQPNTLYSGLSFTFMPSFFPTFIKDFSLSAEWQGNFLFQTENFFSSASLTFQNKKNNLARIVFKPIVYFQGNTFDAISLGIGAFSENLLNVAFVGFSQNLSARYSFFSLNKSYSPSTEFISKDFYRSLQGASYLQKNPYIITSSTELFYTNTSSNLTFAEFLIMQKLDVGGFFDLVYDSKLSYTAGGFIRSDISVLGLTSFVIEFGCGWDFTTEKVYGFFLMKNSL